jgi:hypothetical protein
MTDWADEAADRIYSHASVYELEDIANILRGIRSDALEEAAKTCDKLACDPRMYGSNKRRAFGQAAAAIRALKDIT